MTFDFDSLEDNAVTVRDRDSMNQERIAIDQLQNYLRDKLSFLRKRRKMTKKWVYFFSSDENEGNREMKDLLGGKGANLAEMCSLGLSVPCGFTVTTEACLDYEEQGKGFNSDIKEQVGTALKKVEN